MNKYAAFGLTLETALDFTGVLPGSTAETDVFINEGPIHQKASRPTRIQRRGIRAKLGITASDVLLDWEGVGCFKVSDGERIVYQNTGADEGTLLLFLLSEVIGLILYQRGLFLLHGSAVKIEDNAAVFLGIPGAGKSTTAAAFGKAGHTVLTDDLVAIQLMNGKPYVVPAFGEYKIWKNTVDGLNIDESKLKPSFEGSTKFLVNPSLTDFPQTPVPLHTITLLYPPNSRRPDERIKPLHAPVELLRHFPLPIQLLTSQYLQKHFQDALSIGKVATINQRKRPNGFDALSLFVDEFTIG